MLPDKSFDLYAKHTSAQFRWNPTVVHALDGKRLARCYRLHPVRSGARRQRRMSTLARFTWQPTPAAKRPSQRWRIGSASCAGDEKGQTFGIDRGKFERVVDSTGKALPADKAFHVYNAFIDFHAFCNVFAERATAGRGVQDLKKVGDKLVHAAAFSEPPVGPGSFFKNGEITLEFKGLSQVNGKLCALIGYDSGESSFKWS
jgi:hypothetical protein